MNWILSDVEPSTNTCCVRKALNPAVDGSLDDTMFQFPKQTLAGEALDKSSILRSYRYFVSSPVVSSHAIVSSCASSSSKPMLTVCDNLVLVKVLQNIAYYDAFLDITTNACKGDWYVVTGFILYSLLEDCSYVGRLPVFGDGPSVHFSWMIMAMNGEIVIAQCLCVTY